MNRFTAFALLAALTACGGAPTPPPDDAACPAGDRYVAFASAALSGDAVLDATIESAGGGVLVDLGEIGARAVCVGASTRAASEAAGVTLVRDGRVGIPPGETIRPVGPSALAVVGQWHLGKVGAPSAWPTSQGSGVTIVVIDTGADGTHAGLRERIIGGTNYTDGRPCGAGLNCDGHGHGTHVAATAAETLDGGLPPDIAGGTGIAPRAWLYVSKALDDQGSGWSSDIARAILDAGNRAAAGQRTIVSMSLGASQPDAAIRDAVGYATRSGALVVAARGNAGGTSPSWPACFEPVVGVAATGRDDRRAPFSDRGDCTDIAAPGVDIVAAVPGGGYAAMSGTSMSTPMVSGALALLMSLGDADPVTTLLATMATGADSSIPGRLDVAAAVRAARPGATVTALPTSPDPVVTEEATRNPYPGPGTPTWTPTLTPLPVVATATRTRTPVPTSRPTDAPTVAPTLTSTPPPAVATTAPPPTSTATRTATPTRTPPPAPTLCTRDVEVWARGRPNGWVVVRVLCVPPPTRRP